MARNEWEDMLQSVLQGGLKGYEAGRASKSKLLDAVRTKQLESEIEQQQMMSNLAKFKSMSGSGVEPVFKGGKIGFESIDPYARRKTILDIEKGEREALEATPEGQARQARQKAAEQALIKTEQETATSLSKAGRLIPLAKRIEEEWLKTDPYTKEFKDWKGRIRPTALLVNLGVAPILGYWDIIKKGAQATGAQRTDLTYADFVGGLRAQLARAMGDVGNLSEYEQAAVVGLVPKLINTYEVGKDKIQKIFSLVEDIKEARRQGYQDVSEMYEKRTGTKLTGGLSDLPSRNNQDTRLRYNALREQGLSTQEAKKRLGL